eukprot:gnl/TRDRNA2_/TRDRNA2_174707_c1_seq14.p2 gnl/TRDRNA2_/TRDRNA2_174707_c1~~gnl/TRDRNA2_/TRDRNA2_174707_c1_seq14.p2  ORF type:complete len:101 (+),score=21.38 gnl/TRDRNA2_/TRDRNA2_174707_c1_seq14:41-304(+)
MRAAAIVIFALALASVVPSQSLKVAANDAPGMEGQACSDDEHARYQTVVCKVMDACGCEGITCKLEWCAEYVHKWKLEFGACTVKGC